MVERRIRGYGGGSQWKHHTDTPDGGGSPQERTIHQNSLDPSGEGGFLPAAPFRLPFNTDWLMSTGGVPPPAGSPVLPSGGPVGPVWERLAGRAGRLLEVAVVYSFDVFSATTATLVTARLLGISPPIPAGAPPVFAQSPVLVPPLAVIASVSLPVSEGIPTVFPFPVPSAEFAAGDLLAVELAGWDSIGPVPGGTTKWQMRAECLWEY